MLDDEDTRLEEFIIRLSEIGKVNLYKIRKAANEDQNVLEEYLRHRDISKALHKAIEKLPELFDSVNYILELYPQACFGPYKHKAAAEFLLQSPPEPTNALLELLTAEEVVLFEEMVEGRFVTDKLVEELSGVFKNPKHLLKLANIPVLRDNELVVVSSGMKWTKEEEDFVLVSYYKDRNLSNICEEVNLIFNTRRTTYAVICKIAELQKTKMAKEILETLKHKNVMMELEKTFTKPKNVKKEYQKPRREPNRIIDEIWDNPPF
jgi:hypothetical protein